VLDHRPVNVEDERRYLLGLAVLVSVPVVVAVGWFGVPTGTAVVTVDTAGVDGPVNVTVGKSTGDGPLVRAERTLTDEGGVVFETRVPVASVVSVRAGGEHCSVDLRLARENEPPAWFTNRPVVEHVERGCAVGVVVEATVE
jgi:hypothetical protein